MRGKMSGQVEFVMLPEEKPNQVAPLGSRSFPS